MSGLERLEARHGLESLTRNARQAVLISFVLLIALLLISGWQLRSNHGIEWLPVLVRALPLVLFLPSILTRRPRGHAWLAFVSLLYIAQGAMLTTLPGQAWLGWLEVLAALVLFFASALYARWQSRLLRR
ncbi:DUF2069 domain-containing protein [Halomonas sp. HP20-15]|uniref:DUF2069 domain-containing protein n=1 Tax=Halomonas sp. HP20-15 TaxID=3085901 RepID=UPI002982B2A3|nr:DUF2069 domain-containing protein [Halomonas sp. HP20-15]MDW5375500.1 DUF2069 domain-containing protein [Halomonas sp. HP20-15]